MHNNSPASETAAKHRKRWRSGDWRKRRKSGIIRVSESKRAAGGDERRDGLCRGGLWMR